MNVGDVEAIFRLVDHASPTLRQIRQELGQAESSANSAGGAFDKMSTILGGMVGADVVMRGLSGAFGFLKDAAIGMNSTLETSTLQFETLMGNADLARSHVQMLFDFAKKTPFETGPIIAASKQLQTFGGDALNTKKTLTMLGDAAAVTGAPFDELGMWVGRMYASLQAGKPVGEAMQRLSELAVITPQARMQIEALANTAGNADAKWKIFEESLKRFTGGMEKQAATWEGVVSSFSDVLNLTLAAAFEPVFSSLRDAIGDFNDWMTANEENVSRWVDGVSGYMRDVVNEIGLFASGIGATFTEADRLLTENEGAFGGWSGAVVSAISAIGHPMRSLTELWDWTTLKLMEGAKTSMELLQKLMTAAATWATITGQSWVANKWFDEADKLGQSIQHITDQSKAYKEMVDREREAAKAAAAEVAKLAEERKQAAFNAKVWQGPLPGAPKLPPPPSEADRKAAEKAAKEAAKIAAVPTWQWIANAQPGVPEMLEQWDEVDAKLPSMLKRVDQAVGTNKLTINALSTEMTATADHAKDFEWAMQKIIDASGKASKGLGATLLSQLGDFPQMLASAFQGGGNIKGAFSSLASTMGGTIGEDLFGKLAAKGSSSLAKLFGTGITQTLGTLIPGIGGMLGSLAGPALSKAIGWVGGLFSNKNKGADADATKQIGTMQTELLKTYGSLDKIRELGAQVGVDLAGAWGDKSQAGLKHFTKLAEEFKTKLDAQNEALAKRSQLESDIASTQEKISGLEKQLVPTWEAASAVVEKYGISLDTIGPKVMGLKITDAATAIINDFETITAAGGDVGTVLTGMSDEISALVLEAKKSGTELPAQMKPWVEELKKQGQLVDENGEKITDLAGVKFGEPIKTENDKVRESIGELKKTLDEFVEQLKSLPSIAAGAAAGMSSALATTTFPSIVDPGSVPPIDPPGYAGGTHGQYIDFGSGTLTMLHGRERVVTEAEGRGGGGPLTFVHPIVVDGREIARAAITYTRAELARMGR